MVILPFQRMSFHAKDPLKMLHKLSQTSKMSNLQISRPPPPPKKKKKKKKKKKHENHDYNN